MRQHKGQRKHQSLLLTHQEAMGVAQKAQKKATPLCALTLKNLEDLDKKQVRDCAYENDKEKPKDCDVCLSKVKKHVRA
jgi:hypothetical protein